MPTINPQDFQFHIWCGYLGYSSCELWNYKTNSPLSPWVELGRVDAISIPVRPHYDEIAVMLENSETFEKVWLHILPTA